MRGEGMINLDVLKARVKAARGHGVPTLVVATVELEELLVELERLEAGIQAVRDEARKTEEANE
jgi:hypothetical protein